MTYEIEHDGASMTVEVAGRLDTKTTPELEEVLIASADALEGVEELIFDFSDLEYISSSGLRLLLVAQKIMNKQGSMHVINANEAITDVFEVTGFDSILNINKCS